VVPAQPHPFQWMPATPIWRAKFRVYETDLSPPSRLRMGGAVPPPRHMPSQRAQGQVYIYLTELIMYLTSWLFQLKKKEFLLCNMTVHLTFQQLFISCCMSYILLGQIPFFLFVILRSVVLPWWNWKPIQFSPYTFLQSKVTIDGVDQVKAKQVFTLRDSSSSYSEISLDGRKVSSSVCGLCFILL
jgi:hypothetical protein